MGINEVFVGLVVVVEGGLNSSMGGEQGQKAEKGEHTYAEHIPLFPVGREAGNAKPAQQRHNQANNEVGSILKLEQLVPHKRPVGAEQTSGDLGGREDEHHHQPNEHPAAATIEFAPIHRVRNFAQKPAGEQNHRQSYVHSKPRHFFACYCKGKQRGHAPISEQAKNWGFVFAFALFGTNFTPCRGFALEQTFPPFPKHCHRCTKGWQVFVDGHLNQNVVVPRLVATMLALLLKPVAKSTH